MQAAQDLDLATDDLGPLAWVLDELRKSLESASSALRRFVRDANLARGQDMTSVDTGQLRIARQHMHQAVGALEMVGLGAPAQILRCMEAAVQKFVERPELCTEPASQKVERAGFALTEYLEALLHGKAVSSLALFPQYKEVQEVSGADRVHPADLWPIDWRWNEPAAPAASHAIVYDPAVRAKMDQAVLKIVKSADAAAARELAETSLGLASTQTAKQPKVFWKICAGYFEAVSLGLLPSDLYVKRAASRILLQYATLAKGELGVSDRLAQDLVFFCAQAVPKAGQSAASLQAVRQAYDLGRHVPVDYSTSPFGRFDPVLLGQARKRIAAAKETWSSLSGGDANKVKSAGDQFRLVTDSLLKLYPPSEPLVNALNNTVETVVRSGRAPATELAMEVATAVLYLEAAFQDLDPNDSQLPQRTARLAQRLEHVRGGGEAEPLESWMEDLYRRVSDRQTMGSVVGELRGTMGELEKLLDQFFRNPADKGPLADAPSHLSQMRGVLSVLGLDQAANAVQRMRENVESIIETEVDEDRARSAGTFDKLGNNLGALGFLIDMLNYQPALAKKLFVYDEAEGELRPLMGRTAQAHAQPGTEAAVSAPEALPQVLEAVPGFPPPDAPAVPLQVPVPERPVAQAPASVAAPAPVAVPPATPAVQAAMDDEDGDDELLGIFLDEAREVVAGAHSAVQALAVAPSDVSELTTLRRAFHTLKGSSRMVGLNEFGEAAWSMEQLLNTWLADQKPASEELRSLAGDAMTGFGRWVEDIARHRDGAWKASMFRAAADALRNEHRRIALTMPSEPEAAEAAALPQLAQTLVPETAPESSAPPAPQAETPRSEAPMFEAPVFEAPVFEAPVFEAPAFETPALEAPAFEAPAAEAPRVDVTASDVPTIDVDVEPAPELPAETIELVDDAEVSFNATQVIRAEAVAAAELPADEVPPEFDFDLGTMPDAKASFEPPQEIAGIDFDSLSAVAGAPVTNAPASLEGDAGDEPHAAHEAARDEQVKVIGNLRIGIPLYNVFLNEADEWSRRLVTEVSEWAMELNQPVPDSTIGWAHSLAGSSATVGFRALSDIARALEAALGHTHNIAAGTPQHALAFTAAAEEIRRLLHQFAAGFLKEADPQVRRALDALADLDVLPRDRSGASAGDSAFGDIAEPAAEPASRAAPAAPAASHIAPAAELARPIELVQSATPDAAAPGAARIEGDEDIDVADVIDPDLFPIFEEEAVELLPQLGGAMRQWHARPENKSARDECLRALHTLKGSARLAGALRLGELAHRLESEIEYLGSEAINPADIEALLHRFDTMQSRFDALRTAGAGADAPVVMPGAATSQDADGSQAAAEEPSPVQSVELLRVKTALAMPQTMAVAPSRAGANQAVRVRSQLLDRLVNQAGEVMITRSRLEEELRQLRGSLDDLTGNLDRLRAQLREIEVQAESQMQSRLAQSKETSANFDPLEFDRFTRVQELTRFMAESVNDVATVQRNIQRVVEATEDDLIAQARQTRELQRDLLRTRMVEFEGISDRLYRVIRLAAKETGKQVKLDIVGGSIEMDRGVLDRMTPAFEHLLRNCVAHGIELPSTRSAHGKDATGSIVVSLQQEGNDVSVEFRDDGAGLDVPRIRAKALQQGLITPEQQLTDAEAAGLIFMPGFSTATQVTELAGRGIGMDVVRAEVNALGGRIETSTEAGRGTAFRLILPLTTAVTQVVMIRCGSLSIGVPANLIEIVRRATAKDVQQAYNAGTYEFQGETLPFFWSGALLQSSARSIEPQGKTLPVIVFRSASQRVAVHVDEVLGNQEVVVKNLGPQLSRLPGLAGMTVLASGAVVLIYNPVALAQVYGEQARRLSADKAQPEMMEAAMTPVVPTEALLPQAPVIPLVLVVDDSITVRRVTQRLLQREGYRVALAADGLQALERLSEERPAVVLSDIEMPRMDGFDLARNIRNDTRLAGLPVIMITSRIAEKHREHAKELGVNHYLGKPYSEEELLSLVKHYAAAAAAV